MGAGQNYLLRTRPLMRCAPSLTRQVPPRPTLLSQHRLDDVDDLACKRLAISVSFGESPRLSPHFPGFDRMVLEELDRVAPAVHVVGFDPAPDPLRFDVEVDERVASHDDRFPHAKGVD